MKVKHCIGIQGLWPPYGVAYCGSAGSCAFTSVSTQDRVLVLDDLLSKVETKIGSFLQESVLLVAPSGPGPFTGLRAVAAFLTGLLETLANVYVINPSVFDLCVSLLPNEGAVNICVPHHSRSVFKGECVVQDGKVALKRLLDISIEAGKELEGAYYCNMRNACDEGSFLSVGAPECARYGWQKSADVEFKKTVSFLYPSDAD